MLGSGARVVEERLAKHKTMSFVTPHTPSTFRLFTQAAKSGFAMRVRSARRACAGDVRCRLAYSSGVPMRANVVDTSSGAYEGVGGRSEKLIEWERPW